MYVPRAWLKIVKNVFTKLTTVMVSVVVQFCFESAKGITGR